MKRYLVFAFDDYYPCGGWDDLVGDADDMDAAHLVGFNNRGHDTVQIVDTKNNEVVTNMPGAYFQPVPPGKD